VATPAKGVLLDAARNLVDQLGAEPHDMEGVQDGDGVGQPVADGVGIARNGFNAAVSMSA
jgi:hypothetical protein